MLDARARARFARSRAGMAGAAVVAALVVFAAVGPLVARHGPFESDFVHGVSPSLMPVGPCAEFPLGADRIYRDVLARLAWAGRLSLTRAFGFPERLNFSFFLLEARSRRSTPKYSQNTIRQDSEF